MVKLTSLIFDAFDRKTKLYPMFILIIPLLFIVWIFFPISITDVDTAFKSIMPFLVLCGITTYIAQLGRKRGKKLEPTLWAKWGGMPSLQILRHTDTTIDSISKANYHKKLAQLVDNTTTPTKGEEAADPVATDKVYKAWSEYLRIHTRGEKFPLVLKELTNYNYWRNLYGLRPIGLILVALGLGICVCHFSYAYWCVNGSTTISIWAGMTNLSFLALWVFSVKEEWVRTNAFEYAKRLIESTDAIYQEIKEDA